MLTREQQTILELLKEIDTICRKNKITYFLSPYFTLCAVTGRSFPKNPTSGAIYMKTGDMERFKNVFEEEPELRRALESMDNNKRFPGFHLRYINKDTLFYKLDDYGKYQYPGIAINIMPLQCEYGPKRKYLWNRMLEDGWKKICAKNGRWRQSEILYVSAWYVFCLYVGENGLGKEYSGILSISHRKMQKHMWYVF